MLSQLVHHVCYANLDHIHLRGKHYIATVAYLLLLTTIHINIHTQTLYTFYLVTKYRMY